jgi:hypothetical protein
MVPLQIPGPPELLVIVFALLFQFAIPAFVALVVYQFIDGLRGMDRDARSRNRDAARRTLTSRLRESTVEPLTPL